MNVEVLYVADCPSHPAAVKLLKDILAAEGLPADVHEILVTDEQMACVLRFPGSPTIRINDRDVDPREGGDQANFSLSCRWHPGANRLALPSAELIRRAILASPRSVAPRIPDAKPTPMKQSTGTSASLAAILSSIATLSCCLPLGFAAAIGTGAASAFFTTLRPWLLGLSVALIAFGFWQQHRAKQCAVRGRLLGNVLLWAAVAVVLGMILFPQEIAGVIADRFTR